MDVVEYFHKKYYSDLPINKVADKVFSDPDKVSGYMGKYYPAGEYIKYMNSPQYIDIAKRFYGEDKYKEMLNLQTGLIKNVVIDNSVRDAGADGTSVKQKYVNPDGSDARPNYDYNPDTNSGKFVYGKDAIKIPGKVGFNIDPLNPNGNDEVELIMHEYSHQSDQGMPFFTSKESGIGDKSTDFLTKKWNKYVGENAIKETEDFKLDPYLSQPTEIRARINALRERLIRDNPSIDFKSITDDDLDNKVFNKQGYQEVLKVLPKDKALYLMKNFASTDSNKNNNLI